MPHAASPHPPPADPDVARHLSEVVAALSRDLLAISTALQRRLATDITDLGAANLDDLLRASVQGNVENVLHVLEHGIGPDHVEPPSAAFEYARRLAQRDIPVNALVRAYRLGQQHLVEVAFAEVLRQPMDPATRSFVHQHIVLRTFDYIDWMTQEVVDVYQEERERWLLERNSARSSGVARVLSGDLDDPAVAEQLTGYRFDRHHIGLVLWSERPLELTGSSTVDAALRSAMAAAGIDAAPLVVPSDQHTAWVWAPAPNAGRGAHPLLDALRHRCDPVVDHVAVGDAAPGVEGFRLTHRQARQAQTVALLAPRRAAPVVAYRDPGLSTTALLCHDLPALRQWVASVLGGLGGGDEAQSRLRETLLTFLRNGESYTATGEALYLHKNSVKYRVARAEEQLPGPLHADRVAVELALNAYHWLGPEVLAQR